MTNLIITENINATAQKLSSARTKIPSDSAITLCFRTTIILPSFIVMITSWAMEMKSKGVSITVNADDLTFSYLKGMGFIEAIAPNTPSSISPSLKLTALPIQLLTGPDAHYQAVNNLCELILKQFTNSRQLLPALEWAVNEVTDNIFTHSASPTPGVLAAQYYPLEKQIEVAIADQGIGYLGTLGPSHGAANDRQAITMALKRGLTRDAKIGQGNGLAGTETIIESNGGELMLWTGTTAMVRSEQRQFSKFSSPNGVCVVLRLNVDYPVDLDSVWIGQPSRSYIDTCVDNLDSNKVLRIADECQSVGYRQPAKALRNKLLALLPDIEKPIALDFSGCSRPSSSFLDELFGRLILEIGINAYHKKIEIHGLDSSSLDQANVVIHQRLEFAEMQANLEDYVDF